MNSAETATCRYCGRPIINVDVGIWIDPEATGDDAIWSEVCDAHDTFEAEHEPNPLIRQPGDAKMVPMSTDITITMTDNEGQARDLVRQANERDYTSLDLVLEGQPPDLAAKLTPEIVEAIRAIYGHSEIGVDTTNERYSMYTAAGNAAVARLVGEVANAMHRGDVSRRGLPALLHAKVVEVAASHPEVHDTEPEWAIVDEINPVCDDLGWKPIGRDDL